MILIKSLRKHFKSSHGRVEALRGINLEVAEGEFCVLLGPSGSGSTGKALARLSLDFVNSTQ